MRGVGDTYRDDALCKGKNIDLWYPPLDTDVPERFYSIAREVCRRCPVWRDCLDDGADERWGMWGGLTPVERKALGDEKPRASAFKPHGTWLRYRQGCRCSECVDAHEQRTEKINLNLIPSQREPLNDLEMLKYGLLSPKEG